MGVAPSSPRPRGKVLPKDKAAHPSSSSSSSSKEQPGTSEEHGKEGWPIPLPLGRILRITRFSFLNDLVVEDIEDEEEDLTRGHQFADHNTRQLRYERLEWARADYRQLAGALRSCRKLEVLMLMRMNLTHADLDIILTGLCAPKRLKVLELGFAENLTHLPDLSALSGLKSLGLYGCTSLRELPDVSSLRDLRKFTKPRHLNNIEIVFASPSDKATNGDTSGTSAAHYWLQHARGAVLSAEEERHRQIEGRNAELERRNQQLLQELEQSKKAHGELETSVLSLITKANNATLIADGTPQPPPHQTGTSITKSSKGGGGGGSGGSPTRGDLGADLADFVIPEVGNTFSTTRARLNAKRTQSRLLMNAAAAPFYRQNAADDGTTPEQVRLRRNDAVGAASPLVRLQQASMAAATPSQPTPGAAPWESWLKHKALVAHGM